MVVSIPEVRRAPIEEATSSVCPDCGCRLDEYGLGEHTMWCPTGLEESRDADSVEAE